MMSGSSCYPTVVVDVLSFALFALSCCVISKRVTNGESSWWTSASPVESMT